MHGALQEKYYNIRTLERYLVQKGHKQNLVE